MWSNYNRVQGLSHIFQLVQEMARGKRFFVRVPVSAKDFGVSPPRPQLNRLPFVEITITATQVQVRASNGWHLWKVPRGLLGKAA